MYYKQYYDGIYLTSDKKKLIIDKVLSFYSDKSEHDILKRFFKWAEESGNNKFYKIIDKSLGWSQTEEGWLFWYKAQVVLILAYLYYMPNDHDALVYSKALLIEAYQCVERKKLEKTAFFRNASKIVRRLTDNIDFEELYRKTYKVEEYV